jgi:hypothetical protein
MPGDVFMRTKQAIGGIASRRGCTGDGFSCIRRVSLDLAHQSPYGDNRFNTMMRHHQCWLNKGRKHGSGRARSEYKHQFILLQEH